MLAIDCIPLLNLKPHQEEAVRQALDIIRGNTQAFDAVQRDVHLLESGSYRLDTSEEDRIRLYGERFQHMHAIMVLLARLPWLVEKYQSCGIPEQYLVDTLSDVGIWMDVCERKTGRPGLLEYGWLCNHFSFNLFRIGRLQFIAQKSGVPAYVYRHTVSGVVIALCPGGITYTAEGNGAEGMEAVSGCWTSTLNRSVASAEGSPVHRRGCALRNRVALDLREWESVLEPGDLVLDMHIAEGCPLAPEEVQNSLQRAPGFFREYLGISGLKAMTCSSWLLDDNIAQMMPDGNISKFQKNFYLVPQTRTSDWQMKQRVFGDPEIEPSCAAGKTSLQKSIAAWYRAGRRCRNASGFILL